MNLLLRLASLVAGLLGVLTVADLKYRTSGILLWPLKLLATASAPPIALLGAALALLGLKRRDPLAAAGGMLGAALSSRYILQSIAPHQGFEQAFGPGWQARIPPARQDRFLPRRWTPLAAGAARGTWQRNLAYGANPETGAPLLADLWLPPAGVAPSGLGVVYVHGGAWRLGTKDMGTRPFFRRLASQGHVVMDVEYTLAPATDVPGEVRDVKRALIWLKQNASTYGVNPERIVLMGGSAGGHLALLTAYSPNDPDLQPDASPVDTSVRAVVSFYGPADFLDVYDDVARSQDRLVRRKRIRPYGAAVEGLLQLSGLIPPKTPVDQAGNYVAQLLGAEPYERPELYQQLSPTGRVGPHCPPTLLLQGTADIFGIARSARRLYHALQAAGVPSILVESPNTDHAFDLVLPRVSPAAQAATYDVERFLALMA
jgi:acetyl esterase/lipase